MAATVLSLLRACGCIIPRISIVGSFARVVLLLPRSRENLLPLQASRQGDRKRTALDRCGEEVQNNAPCLTLCQLCCDEQLKKRQAQHRAAKDSVRPKRAPGGSVRLSGQLSAKGPQSSKGQRSGTGQTNAAAQQSATGQGSSKGQRTGQGSSPRRSSLSSPSTARPRAPSPRTAVPAPGGGRAAEGGGHPASSSGDAKPEGSGNRDPGAAGKRASHGSEGGLGRVSAAADEESLSLRIHSFAAPSDAGSERSSGRARTSSRLRSSPSAVHPTPAVRRSPELPRAPRGSPPAARVRLPPLGGKAQQSADRPHPSASGIDA